MLCLTTQAELRAKGWELRRQEGDGNCLFRAISQQIYGDPGELVSTSYCPGQPIWYCTAVGLPGVWVSQQVGNVRKNSSGVLIKLQSLGGGQGQVLCWGCAGNTTRVPLKAVVICFLGSTWLFQHLVPAPFVPDVSTQQECTAISVANASISCARYVSS